MGVYLSWVRDGEAAKMYRVKRKYFSEVWPKYRVYVCVCGNMIFLTLPRQGTTPQILKMEFPMQIWSPKQKFK
jgi:hypothetical protein